MSEIAVYGKGGIGKSTLSANLSAALALEGKRVLQIGCDPKHDSTRLLTHGKEITTVLDYIRVTGPADYRIEDVLFTGFAGIGCVEAGGPKPGVGCAGRGIITAFELLDQFHIKQQYDTVLYDVLGDVVCGGFAVPIRREYADTIFVVTSGEYMALYAANNILRGIRNYDREECRVAGLLYNSRNVEDEDRRVKAFAEAVGLPICAKVPRSDLFAQAEKENRTLVELAEQNGETEVSEIFRSLAGQLCGGIALYEAKPLTDSELERVVLGAGGSQAEPVRNEERTDAHGAVNRFCAAGREGREERNVKADGADEENDWEDGGPGGFGEPTAEAASAESGQKRYLSKNMVRSEPLHGCAFNGAVSMSVHIRDAVILAHSPKSCAYISWQTISSSGRRRLFERGALLPVSLSPNFESTDMGEAEMIFGGMDKLKETLERISDGHPRAVIVVSSCPAGIIGDDVDQVKELAVPGTPVVTVKADGNLTGDYLQGMLLAYTELARQIVRRGVKTVPNTVNVVFEKVVAKNTDSNFEIVREMLSKLGVTVNCRFLCETTYDRLENFLSAPLNLLAYRDYTGKILESFFTEEFGCRFFEQQFPVGFQETERWLAGIGEFFGRPEAAERLIESSRRSYGERIAALRPVLHGKRLMVITYNHNLDWILKTALDAGMEIVKLGILNFSQDEGFRTEFSGLPVEEDYDRTRRAGDIAAFRPDIVLSNYESSLTYENCVADTIPMCPDVGFFSGVLMAERWAKLLDFDLQGEWKRDEGLFRKYYAR